MPNTLATVTYITTDEERRTVAIPATDFTATHPDLLRALTARPFRQPYAVPAVLYPIVEELAAGHPLTPRAVQAASAVLRINDAKPPRGVDRYCASCFLPMRRVRRRPGDSEYGGVRSGVEFRFAASGSNVCLQCEQTSRDTATGDDERFLRHALHPSTWAAYGIVPDDRITTPVERPADHALRR